MTIKQQESLIKKVLQQTEVYLKKDQGGVKFVSWSARLGLVKVELTGRCATCPLSKLTVNQYIKKQLRAKLPQVKEIEVC
ncbi:NifU family protein [Patescibacteria group bacterium]|nr:NifU family protein [Patescibacteria group bacterium]